MVDIKTKRKHFNQETAPKLAAEIGVTHWWTGELTRPWPGKVSTRFSYFSDDDRFVVVAGDHEGADVDLALAYGLSYCESRKLVLLLPRGRAIPTLQRAAWLKRDRRPRIYEYEGRTLAEMPIPTPEDAIRTVQRFPSLEDELSKAATAVHFGKKRNHLVADLVEWATKDPFLDPAHRKSERAWHYAGQRVLSLKGIPGGIAVTAGIHYSRDGKPTPLELRDTPLTREDFDRIVSAVQAAIEGRRNGIPSGPDEHWLQAQIRRDPTLVGVEQPALREVPAWRPAATPSRWGRGFIDILGLDGHGDIRVVETKLSANVDEMFVLQGLDYYIWTKAYRAPLEKRLGASAKAEIVVHYAIGEEPDGSTHLSPYARDHADALAIPLQFQKIHGWHKPPEKARPRASLVPPGEPVV